MSASSSDEENVDQTHHHNQQMIGSRQVLGDLTHKNNEHVLNAIMRKADREGLKELLSYPKQTVWVKNNITAWFGNSGILSQ
jgi:hypothetical protein